MLYKEREFKRYYLLKTVKLRLHCTRRDIARQVYFDRFIVRSISFIADKGYYLSSIAPEDPAYGFAFEHLFFFFLFTLSTTYDIVFKVESYLQF